MKIRIAALAAFSTLALAAPASAQQGHMQEYAECAGDAQQQHLILHLDAVAWAGANARCVHILTNGILSSNLTDTRAERAYAACMSSNLSAFLRTLDAGEHMRGEVRCKDAYELAEG